MSAGAERRNGLLPGWAVSPVFWNCKKLHIVTTGPQFLLSSSVHAKHVLLGHVALTLHFLGSLYGSLLDYIHMFPNHLAEGWYLSSNLCCQLGSFSFNLLLSVQMSGEFLFLAVCSWLLFSWKHLLLWCDYCMMRVKKSGETCWKGCDLEDGFSYWEDLELAPSCPVSMKIWEQAG